MVDSVPARDLFHHQQLSDPRTHIRLLQVKSLSHSPDTAQRDFDDDTLDCEMTSWPMAEAPAYRAISYTWGAVKDTTWIRINGQHFQVRQNCQYALQQVTRHSNATDYIWIDAICINQSDDDEKSHQVAKFGTIFQQAQLVLACTGAHDQYSRPIFKMIRRNSELFERAGPHYARSKGNREPSLSLEWEVFKWRASQKPQLLIRNICEYLCRPYFQRVWTLPEMRLARNVEILCGDDCVPAPPLIGLSTLVAYVVREIDRYKTPIQSFVHDCVSHIPPRLPRKVILYADDIMHAHFMGCIHAAWYRTRLSLRPSSRNKLARVIERMQMQYANTVQFGIEQVIHTRHAHLWALMMDSEQRDPLESLLEFSSKLKCEDPRDRIFAVLPIVDWHQQALSPIMPNYDVDSFDLCKTLLSSISASLNEKRTYRVQYYWCQELLEALELDTGANTRFQHAVERRRDAHAEERSTQKKLDMPRLGAIGFRGFQIISENGALRLKIPSHVGECTKDANCYLSPVSRYASSIFRRLAKHFRHITSTLKPQLIMDHYDALYAILPHNAQPGDWIVVGQAADGHGFENRIQHFILREQTKGRLHIIGIALITQDRTSCFHVAGTDFLVHFDIEDFMVLCKREDFQSPGWQVFDFLELCMERYKYRVCGSPGSSYAEFRDSPST
ncbi:heterokaryon incompatibility protein-domain-containing protein [Xylariaceae sp. FL1272]|nr:heterokaryon incompatibility protein-domain-containing protein [Xylariaceae sp. FL1272]